MNYRIIYTDELYHHGVKGMKWGVRKDSDRPSLSREQKRTLKDAYKKNDKFLKNYANRKYYSYVDATHDSRRKTKEYVKGEKAKYKSGQITKNEYKSNKKMMIAAKRNFDNQQEYNMAVAQYQVQRTRAMNKQIYIGAVKGKDSKAYQRGEKHLQRNMESWGNYSITQNPDGTYRVVHIQYV